MTRPSGPSRQPAYCYDTVLELVFSRGQLQSRHDVTPEMERHRDAYEAWWAANSGQADRDLSDLPTFTAWRQERRSHASFFAARRREAS